MRETNSDEWARHSDAWVVMQEKSRKWKAEAERLGKHGEKRRRYIAERRKQSR